MSNQNPGDITQLLVEYGDGDDSAYERLFPLVYDELRRIAHLHLRRERSGHTLNTTGLVHECYINMSGSPGNWQDRVHFSAIASRGMRRILVDYARRRNAQKRGGAGQHRVTLDDNLLSVDAQAGELIALDEALTSLAKHDPRLAQLVECRFFGGMTIDETANAMKISVRTAHRDWNRARAYLHRMLYAEESEA